MMDYDVTIREVDAEHLASVRVTCAMAELPAVMGGVFGRIMGALSAEGVQPSGAAAVIYHGWTEDTVDAEIGFTIHGVFFPQDRHSDIRPSHVPGGRVAFTTHVGEYDGLERAYKAIQAYAEANGLELGKMMWERYLTDPSVEPDLSKHVTEVFWPLAGC